MLLAKQSTAKTVIVGPILDSTGAEYASAVIGDLSISKNGGTLTALASAATLTYIANGMYTLVFTTGNLDTLGTAEVSCNKSTYQMRQKEFSVIPATVYDALVTNAVNATGGLVGATGTITTMAGVIATTTNITAATGVTLTATTGLGNQTANITGTISTVTTLTNLPAITANWLTAAGTASDFGAEIATAIWTDTTASDFTTALSVGKSVMNGVTLGTGLTVARCTLTDTLTTYTGNTVQTGDSFARIGAAGVGLTSVALADATSDAVIADAIWNAATASYGSAGSYGLLVETDLDATISSRLSTAGYTAPSNLTAAQIATGVWQDTTAGDFTVALSVGKSLMNGVTLGTGLTVARCTLTDTLTTYTGNTVQTGDSFARIGAAGVSLTSVALADATSDAVIADAVWNAATITYGSAGSYGLLVETDLDATISSRMATYTQPTGFLAATFPATIASTTNITAGTITTATNVTTVNGLAANVITAAATHTDFGAEIADAVWDEAIAGHLSAGSTGLALNSAGSAGDPWSTALPGAYGAGTAGEILGDWKNAGRLDLILDIIAADTTTDIPALIAAEAVKTAAIKVKTDFLPSVTAGAAGGVFIAGANAATSITTALTANIVGNITGNLSGSIGSYTGDTPQTGDSFARIGALGAGLTALATQTSVNTIDDFLDTEIAAIQTAVVTTIPAQITALNNISIANVSTGVTTALTTALTEGYRATNATGSVRDLLYEVLQSISEFTITSTTKTVKKLDGSTTAKTYTLNDATTPTGITETT